MNLIAVFVLIVALVFFLLAGLGIPSSPRLNWIGFGLFFYALAELIVWARL